MTLESIQQPTRVGRIMRSVVAVVLCALMSGGMTGCVPGCMPGCVPNVYPECQRKSLTELYHEALAASENTPDRNGSYFIGPRSASVAPLTPEPATPQLESPAILPPVGAEPPGETVLPPQPGLTTSNEQSDSTFVPVLPATSRTERAVNSGWRERTDRTAASTDTPTGIQTVSHTATEPITAVTEFFEDTDIRQALQSLASQANTTVIIDEQVGGVVSAVIEEEPFESALRKVLLPLGLVWRRTPEGEYLVGIPDPTTPLFGRLSDRTEYRPRHLSPEELGSLIPERDRKFLQIVDARNRILVEAPAEISRQILERLEQLDTPIPQVELEAIVCVISPDSGFKSGLDWNHAVSLNGSEVFNFGLAGLSFAGRGSGAGFSNAFSDFSVTSAFVRLLAQEGYLAIRAAPRVTARDGDQARISITRESYFSIQPPSDQAFFRQEIQQVDAGIELDITPIIRGDNITVKIEKAEVSEDIRTSQLNSGLTDNPFPKINRRTVSTTVHVKDGETVVIGGLVQRQTVDRFAKVPLLGDIPVMGRLFQTVEQKEQDAEVVIFISPRLVQPSPCNVNCQNDEGRL